MNKIFIKILLYVLIFCSGQNFAWANTTASGVQQYGTVTAGHIPTWVAKDQLQDSGVALSTNGLSTQYLNAQGSYTTPASSGGGITALTGDVTASGTGSVAATLATVNSSPGSFGSASQVPQITVNAKGLVTAVTNTTITPSAIGVPTTTGTGASGTWGISISGNSATVTNGVYTTGSYSNPSWLTGVPYSILTGSVPTWNQNTTGTAANITSTSNSTLMSLSALTSAAGGTFGTNAFNSTVYQTPITLTTSGSSGASTFSGGVLNIPQYSGGSGTVNSGTQYQLGYYATTGTAISGNANIFTDATNDFTIAATTSASSGTKQISSPSYFLQGNAWNGTSSVTGSASVSYTPTNTTSPLNEIGLLQFTSSESAANTSHLTRFYFSNEFVSSNNSNDNLGAQFGETFNTAYFGLENSSSSANGSVPGNGYLLLLALGNNGEVGTVSLTSGNGPNYKNVLDDGTSKHNLSLNVSGAQYQINSINALSFPTSDTTAGASIAIGSSALSGQTSSAAYGNTAVGYQALDGAMTTTGTQNTAVGYAAMKTLTSGSDNVAIGYNSLSSVTSGQGNAAVGGTTLQSLQNGNNNMGMGGGALYHLSGGSSNVAVGQNALYNATGTGNTAIGYGAGGNYPYYGITSGNYNVIIGPTVATNTLTTGSNNILIGTNSGVDTQSSSSSNTLNIGNLIYGTGLASSGTTPAGMVGVGTASPAYSVDTGATGTIAAMQPHIYSVGSSVTASTSGTVSSGTQYQLGYYASTGTVLSGNSNITTDSSNDLLVTTGSVGIGTSTLTTGISLDLHATTGAVFLPVGTTGQEPTGIAGMIRYNSTVPQFEGYISGAWSPLGGGGGSGSGNRVLIGSEIVASNTPSVTFNTPTTYNRYEIVIIQATPVNNNVNFNMTTSPTGGSWTIAASAGYNSGVGTSCVIDLYNTGSGVQTVYTATGGFSNGSGTFSSIFSAYSAPYDSGTATTSVTFSYASGNINGGRFILYGIVN